MSSYDLSRYDAVVLSGGSGRRLGGVDKAGIEVAGRSLLDRVLVAAAGAARTVCVGPARSTAASVSWCRERPPGGGPVAALAAAMAHVDSDTVVVLAVDLPFLEAETVEALVRALAEVADHDGAVAVDGSGRLQPLLAAYRRVPLAQALSALPAVSGASMRDLTAPLTLARVPAGLAAFDCDTAGDLEAAARVAAGRETGDEHAGRLGESARG